VQAEPSAWRKHKPKSRLSNLYAFTLPRAECSRLVLEDASPSSFRICTNRFQPPPVGPFSSAIRGLWAALSPMLNAGNLIFRSRWRRLRCSREHSVAHADAVVPSPSPRHDKLFRSALQTAQVEQVTNLAPPQSHLCFLLLMHFMIPRIPPGYGKVGATSTRGFAGVLFGRRDSIT
jgi:hypothetical protein